MFIGLCVLVVLFLLIIKPHLYEIVGGGTEPSGLSPLFKKVAKKGVLRITGPDASRIIIAEPELIKDVAIRKADLFIKPDIYGMLNIFGTNIVGLNDSYWKKHRAVADPAFAEDHMDFLTKSSYNSGTLAIEKLETKRANGRLVIDAHQEMQLVTLDIIGKVAFGYDFGVFELPPIKAPHTMTFVESIKTTMVMGLVVGGLVPSWLHFLFPKITRAIRETESYMKELIKHRLENMKEKRYDLLSLLVTSNSEQIAEKSLTEQELIADVFIFLLAGHETSATTLTWMLYELALHPDVQEKMHEEVTRVIGTNKSPSIEKYYELTFVRNSVQETLRKRPPISLIPKLCRTKTTIGDYEIPENTEVYLNAYEAQHDERYWKSPHSFIPERFDPTSDYYTKRPSGTLIPFSIGHRKCIGSSEIETAMVISKLIQNYRIILPKDDPSMQTEAVLCGRIPTRDMVTLHPRGLKVELVART